MIRGWLWRRLERWVTATPGRLTPVDEALVFGLVVLVCAWMVAGDLRALLRAMRNGGGGD